MPKLSQITPAAPVTTDQIVGVKGGATDALYSVSQIIALGGGAARTQRSITSSGNLPVTSGDAILNINATTDLVPTVPLASGRSGVPLTFKSVAGSHIQTLMATSPDTFDGAAMYSLASGASVTLVPYNDGVNAGYGIE